MEKFIPFEKLSKKEQRRRNAEKRNTWGAISPVTRRSENPKIYKRQKAQRTFDDAVLLVRMGLALCNLNYVNYIP